MVRLGGGGGQEDSAAVGRSVGEGAVGAIRSQGFEIQIVDDIRSGVAVPAQQRRAGGSGQPEIRAPAAGGGGVGAVAINEAVSACRDRSSGRKRPFSGLGVIVAKIIIRQLDGFRTGIVDFRPRGRIGTVEIDQA